MTPKPFHIHVPDADLHELRNRLDSARFPTPIDADSWDDGTSLEFLQRLRGHWLHTFDWRVHERRLNLLPQFVARIDGIDIHFVHQRGKGPSPLPLIITHGWPGSFIEMERIIPLLTDPAAHGGDRRDAFDVVVPSLPGFGFSSAPVSPGVSSRRVAKLWLDLMSALGYARFAAQGGDIGAGVSVWLARLSAERLIGVHLNYVPGSFRPPLGPDMPPVSKDERTFLDKAAAWASLEGAYAAVQSTKPLTLSYALTDSPIGLAAWMSEKFRSWSDCDGDIERIFTLDELLTNISMYWLRSTLTASLRMYKENRLDPLVFEKRLANSPPVAFAAFPRELPTPPRSWVERALDVQRWATMPRGGHFAALEQPELLAEDIRQFYRPLR